MRACDLAHDCKAQAGTIGAAGHERLKQPLAKLLRYARPGITNAQAEPIVRTPRGKNDRAACRRVLDGIEHEVVQPAAHLVDVEMRGNWRTFSGRNAQCDALRGRELRMGFSDPPKQGGDIDIDQLGMISLSHW